MRKFEESEFVDKNSKKARIDIYRYQLSSGDEVIHGNELLIACKAKLSNDKCFMCHLKDECKSSAKENRFIKCSGIVFRKKKQ